MNQTTFEDSVKEWGLANLPKDKQEEMVERIGRLLYQAVLSRAVDILSEKEQTELDLLLNEDTTTADDVLNFIAQKIPDFAKITLEEKVKLKTDLKLV